MSFDHDPIKLLVWGLNSTMFIGGILMLIGGSFLLTERQWLEDVINVSIACPIALIVLGVFAFVIAFAAICDFIRRENTEGEGGYVVQFICLAIFIAPIQFCLIVGAIGNEGNYQQGLPTRLAASIGKYNSVPKVQHKWDDIQRTLECCGSHNYADWKYIGNVSDSCCKEEAESCADGVLDGDVEKAKVNIFVKGCAPEIRSDMGKYVLIGAAVIASIELVIWFFGCGAFCLIGVATFPYHVYCPSFCES